MPVRHDEHGRFAPGPSISVKPADERAFTGDVVNTRKKLSKLETGELSEKIVAEHFRRNGIPDVRSINVARNNAPVDLIGDHTAIEVKTGLVSNSERAQQWRATIGQPGKQETEWLKTASKKDKAAWNAQKSADILDRKNNELDQLSDELGVKMKAKTVGVIIHPDKRRADLYVFDGFHHRIGWNSTDARHAYVGTYSYGNP